MTAPRSASRAGLDVVLVDPGADDLDVAGAVGFVAGTERDTTNLSLAVHVRIANPDVYLVVRQQAHTNSPLVQALDLDAVFMPTELVSREVLARVVTPALWTFIDHALTESDEWAERLIERLVAVGGTRAPVFHRLEITEAGAPAVHRWISRGEPMTIRALLRDPGDETALLPVVPLLMLRDGEAIELPPLDLQVQLGDLVLFAGRARALDDVAKSLYYETSVEYAVTGHRVPETWLWRRLTRRRREARLAADSAAGEQSRARR